MGYKKTIELYLANGSVDSIIIAEMSGWDGKAIKLPRIEISDCTRDDIQGPGVYFLFSKDDDQNAVYIGESENIKKRLVQHINTYNSGDEKFYWNTAVILIGDLDKAVIRYLENRFCEIAKSSKRFKVLTQKTYKTVLKESKKGPLEEFIDNSKILISMLGYKVLEPLIDKDRVVDNSSEVLYLKKGNANAKGMVTTEGFVLLEGSVINEKTSYNSLSKGSIALREKFINSNKVDNYITLEDILFSSSSAASDFVTGYSTSGPQNWKNIQGIKLKELEETNSGK